MSGDNLAGLQVIQHDDTKNYKFYRISSKERVSGTPYDFKINIGNDTTLDRITEIHLISVSVPNVFPNISSNIGNNNFVATATIAGAINFTVPTGFYTTAKLMAELQTQINAVIGPSTIAITQNSITDKIEYVITGAETIDFLSSASGNPMAPYIGILSDSGATGSYVSDATPALNGETMVYIHSSTLARNSTYLSSNTGTLIDVNGAFTIPINVAYGAYQTYQATELDRQVYGRFGTSIRNFNIVLRGNGGRLLTEITDNYETVITIKVFWHTE